MDKFVRTHAASIRALIIKQLLLILTALFLSLGNAGAADVATDAAAASGAHDNSDGGYFEFGIGLNARANKLSSTIVLAGAYRYRGLFFEAFNPFVGVAKGRFEVGGLTLGLNLWHNDHWSVDLLGARTSSSFRTSNRNVDELNSPEPDREKAVLDRDTFYSGAGIRLTGYFGNTIFQYRLVNDTHGGNGVLSSATLGYSRQFRNWNLHSRLSAHYLSKETGQYWFGISEDEASTRFPQFDMGSSAITYSAEIGATYPVRINVVFRSVVRHTESSDEIKKSPLHDGNFGLNWSTTLSYVF